MGTIHDRIDHWGNHYPPDIEFSGVKAHGPNTGLKHTHSIVDNKVIVKKQIVVHTFTVGDVDDPDLYAAEPIYQWQQSDAGKWVMENAVSDSPIWNRYADPMYYGHMYSISATFEEKKLTEFYLRFGKPKQP